MKCWAHRSLLLVLLLLLVPPDAQARMYQWTHPSTKTRQLSGTPPAWYRDTVSGPRVLVFENGQLIDDTAIPLEESRRLALRAAAFGTQTAPAAASAAAPTAPDPVTSPGPTAEAAAATDTPTSVTAAARVSELKALLDDWDRRKLETAKSIVNDLSQQAAPPPATSSPGAPR